MPPKHANLTLLQKLKLYNGKTLPGFTEDNVIELKREAMQRRHDTASARATSRTRSATPWSPIRTRTASIRSWCCTNWKPACATIR